MRTRHPPTGWLEVAPDGLSGVEKLGSNLHFCHLLFVRPIRLHDILGLKDETLEDSANLAGSPACPCPTSLDTTQGLGASRRKATSAARRLRGRGS
jgi:hypothetical protein